MQKWAPRLEKKIFPGMQRQIFQEDDFPSISYAFLFGSKDFPPNTKFPGKKLSKFYMFFHVQQTCHTITESDGSISYQLKPGLTIQTKLKCHSKEWDIFQYISTLLVSMLR